MPIDAPHASVVVPAHQEATTLGRCLDALTAAGIPLEIVVAANGCTDGTADVARQYPGVVVLDLQQGGKAQALNAADESATAFPRLYVDADVVLSGAAALVDALSGDAPRLAVPARRLDVDGASAVVRSYYRSWERLQQCRGDQLGSGVYAVNQAGRSRWGPFPDGIADDYHVHTRFSPSERSTVAGASSHVRPPRTVASVLAVRARVYAGNVEHAADSGRLERPGRDLRPLAADPVAVLGLPVYTAITLLAKQRARRRVKQGDRTWSQDSSARA